MPTRLFLVAALVAVSAGTPSAQPSDLDALMSTVLERRDDNWKKLQQYILEEKETFAVTGPANLRLFGGVREYQWFPRDGFFVRSPIRADGVTIGESDRRKEEERWLLLQQAREKRRAERQGRDPVDAPPNEVGDILRQSFEPEFVRSAYFLGFKFDPGHYALVGREKLLDRDVLRIEYYPTKLFNDDPDDRDDDRPERKREPRKKDPKRDAKGEEIQRQMNKSARVTLWVDPQIRQILQYELHNVDMDFLPGRYLLRADELDASMRMTQPFPNVWLPDTVTIKAGFTMALGHVAARYDVKYSDYRLPSTTVKVK